MIKNEYVILCEKVIVNQETNNATIVETIDMLISSAFPFAHKNLTVMALFSSDAITPEPFMSYIEFYMGKNLLARLEGPISFGHRKRARLVAELNVLPIPSSGVLECRVGIRSESGKDLAVGSQSIEVVDLKNAKESPA